MAGLGRIGRSFIASVLHAAFSSKSAGTSGAAFLKIGAGARPTAMGGAYTALADDANALYWNPAGLVRLEKREFSASHAEMFESTRLDFLAYAHPTSQGTFARSAASANAADSISTATRPPIWPSRVFSQTLGTTRLKVPSTPPRAGEPGRVAPLTIRRTTYVGMEGTNPRADNGSGCSIQSKTRSGITQSPT